MPDQTLLPSEPTPVELTPPVATRLEVAPLQQAPDARRLQIAIRVGRRGVRLLLTGRSDPSGAIELHELVKLAERAAIPLTLDCSHLEAVDGSGLTVIQRAVRRGARVEGVEPSDERVLSLLQADRVGAGASGDPG